MDLKGDQGARIIFHYTSAAGLLGIVKNRRIWATESNFLNDPSEISFAASNVVKQVADAVKRLDIVSERRREMRRSLKWIEEAYVDPHSDIQFHEERSFITSFSYSDDSLTLWRNYAGKGGFCIGFNEDKIVSLFNREFPPAIEHAGDKELSDGIETNFGLNPTISRVNYGLNPTRQLASKIVSTITKDSFNLEEGRHELGSILRSLATVKHPAYEDEREVRLIVRRTGDFSPNPLVRASPTAGLVSYHEVAFPHEALVSITTAPGVEQARSESAVRSLLHDGARGAWSHVNIRSANIPFSW